MSVPGDSDDYYYRTKPATSLIKRQGLSLEARGAADTYEKQMHTRDGTVPDERQEKGMAWHLTVLGVRNSRTVKRLIGELLECGDLVRLGDGRLTNPDVQRELAHRARRRASPRGQGGGGHGSGGVPPVPGRQLMLIDGGRAFESDDDAGPVDDAGDKIVGEMGADRQSVSNRDLETRFTPERGRKTQRNQRATSPNRVLAIHEFAAVLMASPRARGDPSALRA